MINSDKRKIELHKDFEELFIKHFEELCKYAYSYSSDFDIAKDIVQESFVYLWLEQEKYEFSRALLYTIVKHKAIDYLKSSQHKRRKNATPLDLLVETIVLEHSDSLTTNELTECIDRSIDTLSERCKEIFLLSRKKHLKNKEIASQLNISTKAVEKQITKALGHIRKQLAKSELYIKILRACLNFVE